MLRDFKGAREAGFTLVEIMIGMLIGLIGIVVIMQVFAVSEGFKRTATSGTDAQVNGAIALYMLEREIRNSGFGENALIAQSGCTNVNMWDNTAGTTRSLRLVPFEIVDVAAMGIPAADANTDVLLISYGSADSAVEGVQVNQQTNASSDMRVYGNREGFRTGDKVVGVQPGAGPGGTPQCSMHELTKVPGANGNCGQGMPAGGSDRLEHNVTGYPNSYNACAVQPATRNKAGGVTDTGGAVVAQLTFAGGARLYNLGGNPVAKIYAVRGGNLTSCDMFQADCTVVGNYQVVANDIVGLSAIYGQDFEGVAAPLTPTRAVGDWTIDRWTRSVRADFNQVARTIAVGIQVTARSGLKEKPRTGTACDATVNANLPDLGQTADWYAGYTPVVGSLAGAQINLASASADWQCYRYKMFQTTVPIRNMIWRP